MIDQTPCPCVAAAATMAPFTTNDSTRPCCDVCRAVVVVVDAPKPKVSQCARCKGAQYCCVSCQRNDWKDHKPYCQKIVEAKALLEQMGAGS